MSNEKKVIKKENWKSRFFLIGKPIINENTFTIDGKSTKSDWIYNSLSLRTDCGAECGDVWSELMGGYSEDGQSVIYVHGRTDDNSDDFSNRFTVNWEDRFNSDILETIGDMCFITVGLERTKTGVFEKKFLSAYDAIKYIKEHINKDMILNVSGDLKYSMYQGKTQVKKVITKIVINDDVKDVSEFKADFTQSILIDSDSVNLKEADKEKGVVYVNAKVLDYVKEMNGVEIKGQYPFDVKFEYPMDLTNPTKCKTIMDGLFKVKKGYTQITFKGNFIEGGATTIPTFEELPDNIKTLVIAGAFTEEDAIEQCTIRGNNERRMVLITPEIKKVKDGDKEIPVLQTFEEQFSEEDLIFDLGNDVAEDVDNASTESVNADASMDWLNSL